MTITQFIEELKSLPRNLKREARKWVKSNRDEKYCPITAVIKHRRGVYIEAYLAISSAKLIGLRKRDATNIIFAADIISSKRSLRKRMLEALKETR